MMLGVEPKAGKGRDQGGLEEEQAWENGNKEDKIRQSHFNLLSGCLFMITVVCPMSSTLFLALFCVTLLSV